MHLRKEQDVEAPKKTSKAPKKKEIPAKKESNPEPNKEYEANLSEHGKTSGVYWDKQTKYWKVRYKNSEGKQCYEYFYPKHYERETKKQQSKVIQFFKRQKYIRIF